MKNFRTCFCFVSFGLFIFKDNFILEHLTGHMTDRLKVKKGSRKAEVFPFPYQDSSRITKRSVVFKLEFFEYSERVCSCDDCAYILQERMVVPSSLNHARCLPTTCIALRYTKS